MAPRIDSYDFGRVVVDGKEYTADLIVTPTGVVEGWWRKEGHNLVPDDLLEVVAVHPMVLVVGTGADGIMNVPAPTVDNTVRTQIAIALVVIVLISGLAVFRLWRGRR